MLQRVVGELDAPEIAGGVEHFEAKFESVVLFGAGYTNNPKFLDFLGQAVQDLNAGSENRLKGAAN